ncbi:MAG: hypothetical protein Q4E59_03590, partial [Bacteroidales bacterium]|nr:hypothetical protein [Bacteroidales bacterium]
MESLDFIVLQVLLEVYEMSAHAWQNRSTVWTLPIRRSSLRGKSENAVHNHHCREAHINTTSAPRNCKDKENPKLGGRLYIKNQNRPYFSYCVPDFPYAPPNFLAAAP